jgi:hypothetical protein
VVAANEPAAAGVDGPRSTTRASGDEVCYAMYYLASISARLWRELISDIEQIHSKPSRVE